MSLSHERGISQPTATTEAEPRKAAASLACSWAGPRVARTSYSGVTKCCRAVQPGPGTDEKLHAWCSEITGRRTACLMCGSEPSTRPVVDLPCGEPDAQMPSILRARRGTLTARPPVSPPAAHHSPRISEGPSRDHYDAPVHVFSDDGPHHYRGQPQCSLQWCDDARLVRSPCSADRLRRRGSSPDCDRPCESQSSLGIARAAAH